MPWFKRKSDQQRTIEKVKKLVTEAISYIHELNLKKAIKKIKNAHENMKYFDRLYLRTASTSKVTPKLSALIPALMEEKFKISARYKQNFDEINTELDKLLEQVK